MREVYLEESVETVDKNIQKKKYSLLTASSIICYVFGFIWMIMFFYSVQNLELINYVVIFVPFFIFELIGYVISSFKHRVIVDFDYSFNSGTLAFTKVYNQARRKTFITFDTHDIEKLGFYNSNYFKKYNLVDDIKKIYFTLNETPLEGKSFYYIVVNKNAEKYLLVIECSSIFINNIISFSKSYVLEEGFNKWFILIMLPQLNLAL